MKHGIAIGSAIALLLQLSSIANASNFCASFGMAKVVASGLTLPPKDTCVAFNGFIANQPGVLLAGDVCRSSNGATFLFNTFTQSQNLPDSLAGTWSASTGSGLGKECSNNGCTSFAVTVTKCGAISVPAAPPSEVASPLTGATPDAEP
jgi:hypothetical protein